MSTLAHSTDSPWTTNIRLPRTAKLKGDLTADVCVVGAGIAGLSTAYLLAQAGKKVVVLDDGKIGGGQTQVTTAHLSNEIDARYVTIERLHGAGGARLAAESHTKAIDRIEQIARAEQINCEFERLPGYLFAPPDQSSDVLDSEFEAARRTGIVRVSRVDRAPLEHFDTGPCLRFESQAEFHPLKYLAGLARAILRDGGQIFTSTHAEQIDGGLPARVQTAEGTITAQAVVVATNTPVNDIFGVHTKQAAYISYVVGGWIPRRSLERALYWDTADPYHYVRIAKSRRGSAAGEAGDLVIVGGEDHRTGQADDGEERFVRLEHWARERIPQLQDIEFHWAGQVMESVDGLAFIGRNPHDKENVFIATGDSGQGMTHGTIAGMLLTDLFLGRENPWEKLYDPHRISVKAGPEFAKENANTALQYGSWVTPGEISSPSDLKPGEGAILRRGLKKIAVYRDEHGQVTQCSAVCPHLDCIVAWNATERTWDCPCHGSRFSPEGNVLNGPANSGLAKIEDE